MSSLEKILPGLIFLAQAAVCAVWADTPVVVAFGDSTTAPRQVDGAPLTVYADRLGKLLERYGAPAIVNAGVPGDTTAAARERFANDVLAHKPAVVIIQFGINDAAVDVWRDPPATTPRIPLDAYIANLRYFIDEARMAKAQPVLMTPNPLRWTDVLRKQYGKPPYAPDDPEGFNTLLKDYAAAMRTVAKDLVVPLLDVDGLFRRDAGITAIGGVDNLLLDGMHPNAKGHELIARSLVPVIAPLLKTTAAAPFRGPAS